MSRQLDQYTKKINGNYTVSEDDFYLIVDTSNNVVNLFIDTPLANDLLIVEDLGNAATNKIKIYSNVLIDGSKSYEITTNFDKILFRFINGAFSAVNLNKNNSVSVSDTYQVLGNENSLFIDTSGGSFTVTLNGTPLKNESITITDINGTFASYPLTVNGNGYTINGETTGLMQSDFESWTLNFNGSNWNLK